MKFLIIFILFTNFAFAGVILPNIRRNQIDINETAVGAIWTNRQNSATAGLSSFSQSGVDDNGIAQLFSYTDKLKVEARLIASDDSKIATNIGYQLSNKFGVSAELNYASDINKSMAIGGSMKLANNMIAGLRFLTIDSDTNDATNRVFTAGVGMLFDQGKDNKMSLEGYLTHRPDDEDGSYSLSSYTQLGVIYTEIKEDWQYFAKASYVTGEDEPDQEEYEVVRLFVSLEKRLISNLFISAGLNHFSLTDTDTSSNTETSFEGSGLGISLRYVSGVHQIIGTFANNDSNLNSYMTDGRISSVRYSYFF